MLEQPTPPQCPSMCKGSWRAVKTKAEFKPTINNYSVAFVFSPKFSVQVNTAQGFLYLPECSPSANKGGQRLLKRYFMRFVCFNIILSPFLQISWNQFNGWKMDGQEARLKWILEQLGKLAKFLTSLKSS